MSKRTPLFIEIAVGLILTGLISWSYFSHLPFTETISLKTYDLLSAYRKTNPNTSDIRIVEIDDKSVGALGRWPWPRLEQTQLIDAVVEGGAKVIGLNILYSEADQNAALDEMTGLHQKLLDLISRQEPRFKRKGLRLDEFKSFSGEMAKTIQDLKGDESLARSIEQAGNIVLPMYFQPGDPLGNNLDKLPEFFINEKLPLKKNPTESNIPPGMGAVTPLDFYGKAAIATGHTNLSPDQDGGLRRIAPLMRYGKDLFPSFGLQIVREYLNLHRDAFILDENLGIKLGKAELPLDDEGKTFIDFAGRAGTFQRFSAVDVLTGGLPEGSLSKKIVLLGVTSTGGADTYTGPTGDRYTGLEIWANHIENILSQRFIRRPPWAHSFELGSIVLAAIVVIFGLPLLKARYSVPTCLILLLSIVGSSAYLFIQKGLWTTPSYGGLLLLSGFILMVGRRLVFTERGKEMVEAEGRETNKMLGLSFQGQGMLDLAFEKFRKCPVDASIKELLYNLGLDMERKRMFAKAAAVYEHIATVDLKYKDITQKIEILKKASEGAVFGGVGKKGTDATVVVDGLGQFTTLGRYEVQKELGRGAMGIVYLGKDPKINRQVAIKTLRFEDELDQEQTRSIKERFFREAESAGNLTHPNIIRIFDAGEDQDVAYIAMEFLEGVDLKMHCEKGHLLSLSTTLEITAKIADALDYAHKQGVVHRDIKPGNIMLLKDGTLRITDFGIARIQATSKTATGAVLGTPAYMSPEQVNGKKVDGKADIFSLGVTMFELLTGEKPFQADSIAALLYRIANVEHTDPREFNPNIPVEVVIIINKALAKDPENRYQTAGEMAQEIRHALSKINSPPKPTATEAASVPDQEAAPNLEQKPGASFSNDFMVDLEETFKLTQPSKPAQNPFEPISEESHASPIIEPTNLAIPNPAPTDMPRMKGIESTAHEDDVDPEQTQVDETKPEV